MSDSAATLRKLHDVFGQVLGRPVELLPSTTAAEVPGWDSLSHVELMVAVEQAFAVRLTTREVMGLRNVGELVELLARKGS
jgi:acyl carrier protein